MSPAPNYWMYETGGWLAPAIRRYLDGDALSVDDLTLIRVYLRQWIDSPVWDRNPALGESGRGELATLRSLARSLTDRESIAGWLALAEEFGVDPL
jgi:hypothetical protein